MAVAWVSGASSGLGLHIAGCLVESGWQVVGGARSFAAPAAPSHPAAKLAQIQLSALLPGQKGSFTALPLDVSDEESVARFRDAALQAFGPPDALVNAAGLTLLGACEDYSADELRRILDVNFLGAVRMCQAALPLMRERGRGRVVMLSSVNGLLATPFQGAYAASKHAMEGFSEAMMMETAGQGIQVMLVEPGDHRGGSQAYRGRSAARLSCYAAAREKAGRTIARDEGAGADPRRLGLRVARAMNRRRMPARLRVASPSQHLAVFLHDLLPGRLFSRLMGCYYGMNRAG